MADSVFGVSQNELITYDQQLKLSRVPPPQNSLVAGTGAQADSGNDR